MDAPARSSVRLGYEALRNAFSFKRCCFFLSLFITLIAMAAGVILLVAAFVLKPQEPGFTLKTLKVDSYKLSAPSNSSLFVSGLVSLILNAENHNNVGIKYSSSLLHLYHEEVPIGLVRIPQFYQPAHSNNVGVTTQLSLPCINVTQIFDKSSSQDKTQKNVVKMKLLGDIRLRLLLFHVTLPKIKVALGCDIDLSYSVFAFTDELITMKVVEDHIASFPVKSESFSKNCTLALYI